MIACRASIFSAGSVTKTHSSHSHNALIPHTAAAGYPMLKEFMFNVSLKTDEIVFSQNGDLLSFVRAVEVEGRRAVFFQPEVHGYHVWHIVIRHGYPADICLPENIDDYCGIFNLPVFSPHGSSCEYSFYCFMRHAVKELSTQSLRCRDDLYPQLPIAGATVGIRERSGNLVVGAGAPRETRLSSRQSAGAAAQICIFLS